MLGIVAAEASDSLFPMEQLSNQRSLLGIFAVKERRRIDEELVGLSQKEGNLKNQISKSLEGLGGYASVEDIECDLNEERTLQILTL